MTDRIRQLTVTLDRDYRSDDVQLIVSALLMVKHVMSVDMTVVTLGDHMARNAVRAEIGRDLHEAIERVLADRTRSG